MYYECWLWYTWHHINVDIEIFWEVWWECKPSKSEAKNLDLRKYGKQSKTIHFKKRMTKENSLTWVNLSKFPDLFKSTLTIPRKVAWFLLNTHRSTQYICMKVPFLSIDLKYCWWIEKISPVVIKLNMRICFSTVVNANQRLQSAFLSRHPLRPIQS